MARSGAERQKAAKDSAIDMAEALRLHTVRKVATAIGVSISTVRRLIRAGKLPVIRLSRRAVRVSDDDLRAFVASRRYVAGTKG